MRALAMLTRLAERYASYEEGPTRRRDDAQTLLRMCASLDEEGARIYLERFVNKWRLDLTLHAEELSDSARAALTPREEGPMRLGLVRRRPMTELERLVQEELALGERAEQAPAEEKEEITITFQAADGSIHCLP